MTRRGLVLRLVAWTCALAVLVAVVRHNRGIPFDEHVTSANACGVDSLIPHRGSDAIIELGFGEQRVGQLSLLGSSVTTAAGAATFDRVAAVRESVAGDRSTTAAYRLTNARGAVSSATYSAQVLPSSATVRVALAANARRSADVKGAAIASTLNGFALETGGGRTFTSGRAVVSASHPWVVLRNGRCTLLVWGRGLHSATAARRSDGTSFADFLFAVAPAAQDMVALNFTFAYGDVRRGIESVERALVPAR